MRETIPIIDGALNKEPPPALDNILGQLKSTIKSIFGEVAFQWGLVSRHCDDPHPQIYLNIPLLTGDDERVEEFLPFSTEFHYSSAVVTKCYSSLVAVNKGLLWKINNNSIKIAIGFPFPERKYLTSLLSNNHP